MLEKIYFDNNATTQPFPEVVDAMAKHFRESFGNPGSRHAAGRAARQALEDARETTARLLDADPKEVVFTSGGTESTNLALIGYAGRCQPGRIALTAGEHPATSETCRWLREERDFEPLVLKVNTEGRLLTNQFENLSWDALRFATVILAHNETGVIQDVKPLAERCEKHRVPLHLDAVQAVGKIPVSFRELNCTSLALGAHKFHGPRGIGALIIKQEIDPAPLLFGGHQENGKRPGTECVALAVGMAKALEICCENMEERMRATAKLRDALQRGLSETCEPTVVNGSPEHRLPNTLNIAFPGVDGEAMLVNLDLEAVCCSLGSTCASGSAEPAPALVAMGAGEDVYRSAVRFSVSVENTMEEVEDAVVRIAGVVRRLRSE